MTLGFFPFLFSHLTLGNLTLAFLKFLTFHTFLKLLTLGFDLGIPDIFPTFIFAHFFHVGGFSTFCVDPPISYTTETYHMEDTTTTLSYIYVAESQLKSSGWNFGVTSKGICLIWSRGRLFPPSLPCRGTRYRGSSLEPSPAGVRGTTVSCCFFSFFFSRFVLTLELPKVCYCYLFQYSLGDK